MAMTEMNYGESGGGLKLDFNSPDISTGATFTSAGQTVQIPTTQKVKFIFMFETHSGNTNMIRAAIYDGTSGDIIERQSSGAFAENKDITLTFGDITDTYFEIKAFAGATGKYHVLAWY